MGFNIEEITFNEQGLVPAIVQDIRNGKVLMLAYMNEESIGKTIETKTTWFYSRSRQQLWNKGATSGNKQLVQKMSYDCDGDSILIEVVPLGNACHTGEESCFFNNIEVGTSTPFNRNVIPEVYDQIKERQAHPNEDSYTSYLFREGLDKILKKVGEEASEVIIGAKNRDKEELTAELSDLVYHSLVLMVEQGISIDDVKEELVKRQGK
ncbi:bifunctional phosphoribosyl-AMP cyclohydrolase/phosphoribosyl-ATP diphosphatase HisIE [Salirhabdus salicampi]|uniref:bifunctional phosphoribosyl-AMP cyclohydrolase/phosphoribosyl-ATP diphosphatase HisIE n=1 Tax=Salirhabdus salicampi TaxID=476102 RepID=UPI0020C20B51|nr:bifunctional phosphoribosyl-AMP cyclohydrolase/phosphoribosyl-ATP diphosphatase HisIE [Salirhabdus salicampi]MCP8616117.1 bifunctional phosphoribosyl-AMP cyclohydrolase/phosphoribosyl-ATP diphosphatase HisIE [Salirhabdus salicampi]